MEAYQRELQERTNKIKLDEMEKNLERTKKIAGAYKASTKVVREDEDGEIVPVSDDEIDEYESNLIRRICGLIYFPDKLNGEIKLAVINERKSK